MTTQTQKAPPVQGPAQPTHTDLIWATASSQAALDDPALSVLDRQIYLEAKPATYIAAAHLGVEEATAKEYAAELYRAALAMEAPDSTSLAEWTAAVIEHTEPEASL